MGTPIPIVEYRGFYDVPRYIVFRANGRLFLLACPFDERRDQYGDAYQVREIVGATNLSRSWAPLEKHSILIGEVPVASVTFDPTRRRTLASDALSGLLGLEQS